MRLEFLERHSYDDGPLHRLDPRLKLVAAVVFVVAVVATPLGWWRVVAAQALVLAFAVGLSGVSPVALLRRWAAFLVLVLFLAAMVAQGHPARETLGLSGTLAAMLAKNSLAFLSLMVLVHVTPFPALLGAMGRLGTPPVLVATLHFMYRYLFVFTDQLDRMVQARRARTFRRSGRLDWRLLGGLIGALLVRSLERGERVHAAMLARGWDGTLRSLEGPDRG